MPSRANRMEVNNDHNPKWTSTAVISQAAMLLIIFTRPNLCCPNVLRFSSDEQYGTIHVLCHQSVLSTTLTWVGLHGCSHRTMCRRTPLTKHDRKLLRKPWQYVTVTHKCRDITLVACQFEVVPPLSLGARVELCVTVLSYSTLTVTQVAPEHSAASFPSYQHRRDIFLHYRHVQSVERTKGFHDDAILPSFFMRSCAILRGWGTYGWGYLSIGYGMGKCCMVVKTLSKRICTTGLAW